MFNKKFKIIIIISLFFLAGYFFISKNIGNKNYYFLKTIIPNEIKYLLKKTIFIIPTLRTENLRLNEELTKEKKEKDLVSYYFAQTWLSRNKERNELIIDTAYNNENILSANTKREITEISSKNFIYHLSKIFLPFPTHASRDVYKKAGAHIDIDRENLIIALGASNFFFLKLEQLKDPNIKLTEINSNFKSFINSEIWFENTGLTITDILIYNENIFVSYSDANKNDCAGLFILKSKINYEYLNFEKFWSSPPDQCSKANMSHGGGRMKILDEKMILTVGDFGTAENRKGKGDASALDVNDYKGKVLEIDLYTKNYKFLSMGHRNPQGLVVNLQPKLLVITEHGPRGGDEVNIIRLDKNDNSIQNFGWPMSSYGEHYDNIYREWAPLNKSHSDYGFIEPIKYYTPSIATSEIIKINNKFNSEFKNDFFVSSMGTSIIEFDMSIHHLRFDDNFNKIIFEDVIILNDRIRDLIQYKNEVLIYFEGLPSLGILKFVKKYK